MDEFAQVTGRQYKLFEYHRDPTAERRIILMGSACETVHKAVDYLNRQGEKVGVVIIRLYRPFDTQTFIDPLPGKPQYCCFKHDKKNQEQLVNIDILMLLQLWQKTNSTIFKL